MNESDAAVGGGASILTIGYFIFFIFACMSLTKTDTEQIYSVCGHSLREIVMTDVIFGSILIPVAVIIAGSIMACIKCCNHNQIDEDQINGTYAWTVFVYSVILLILGALSLSRYVDASNRQGCFDALSNTTNGMKSPSANLGEPLLAQIALMYGIMYTMVGGIIIIIVIYVMINACFTYVINE
jgi:hypothetical protein